MGAVKNQAMKDGSISAKQEQSYNRYFVNAFTEADIEEIIEAGGGSSKDNFVRKAKDNIKNKDYWNALMNKAIKDKTFVGRDKKVRRSKFQASYDTLADAIYNEKIKDLVDDRVDIREYKKTGKTKTFYYVRKVVRAGKQIEFEGKIRRGGQFLPKSFKIKKG